MNRRLSIVLSAWLCFVGPALAADVEVTVQGAVWDSDSRGFAWYQRLNMVQGTRKAARRGARVSLDGHPEIFDISREGGRFELVFTTSEPSFRLIVEGDRFPPTITQPYAVPEEGGLVQIDRVNTPRGEGNEHTWPLPMMAEALGYGSTSEMLADNKAVIRVGIEGSGEEGAPDYVERARLSFPGSKVGEVANETITNSPFLRRVPQSEYVVPFDMTPQDTYFMPMEESTGFYIIVVSFEPGEGPNKNFVLQIEDTIENELLVPPRPWKFGPRTIAVRNGFATELRLAPDIDQ